MYLWHLYEALHLFIVSVRAQKVYPGVWFLILSFVWLGLGALTMVDLIKVE